jgi:hypothetical protein
VASTFQVLFNGTPAEDQFYNSLTMLEVEENAELPDAVELSLSVNPTAGGDLDYPSDSRLGPLANVAVVAQPEGGSQECIFDGYVLSHKLHLQTATASSTLKVWGQDASWLMNLEEKVREWVNVTDASVANSIFQEYGFDPDPSNADEDSPTHTEDGHSLMQRGSDIQFLRTLARRNGKLCRVTCADTPGQRTGFFAAPDLSADPVLTLRLNDIEKWNVAALDIEWEATRPTRVTCGQGLFTDTDPDAASTDLTDSGLTLLDDSDLATFTGKPMTVLLAAPVDDAGELQLRAQSVLREAGWFVRCEGEADVSRCHVIMRVGAVVEVEEIGPTHSGKYLVWSVRHTITADSHRMKFVLVRNAVGGKAGAPGAGDLVGLAAGLA